MASRSRAKPKCGRRRRSLLMTAVGDSVTDIALQASSTGSPKARNGGRRMPARRKYRRGQLYRATSPSKCSPLAFREYRRNRRDLVPQSPEVGRAGFGDDSRHPAIETAKFLNALEALPHQQKKRLWVTGERSGASRENDGEAASGLARRTRSCAAAQSAR